MGETVSRGLGLVVCLSVATAVGIADGLSTVARSPRGVLSATSAVLVVLHCAAVLLTVGLLMGAALELFLAAARRRPCLVSVGGFVTGGPARWFAPDPAGAGRVLIGGVYFAAATATVLPVALEIFTSFHSKQLAALAVVLLFLASQVLAGLLAVLLAWPIEIVVARLARFASPGAALALLGAASAVLFGHVIVSLVGVLRALDLVPVAIGAGVLLLNVVALGAAGAWIRHRGRPLPRRAVLGGAASAVVAFAVSGATLGARQNVASTIFLYSRVTGVVARALQSFIDLDHDGYSALFGGGDCDDVDPHIHPGAHDTPGNGIDENCTGADANAEPELGDGRMVEVTGPLAGVRPSFALISIDAMRADHVGAYGYPRPTTPNLDRFAASAARFTRAYCTLPRTVRSFGSIWTGRYPSHIAWGSDTQYPELLEDNVTLAETLADVGYVSAAFVNSDYCNRTPGFFKGFGEIHTPHEPGRAVRKSDPYEEVAEVSRYLSAHADDPRPFLLWAHLMEPHDPYRHWTQPHEFGPTPLDHYDEELARADDAVGRLLAAIDDVASRRPIVVAILSDHGEAFGEHGFDYHSTDLHEEQVHVPLLVRAPGVAPGPRSALVSSMDLHATLLNYANLAASRPIDAQSLVGVLQDPEARLREHLVMEVMPDGLEANEQKALLSPPWKLISDVRRGFLQLHDLDRDPREERNLFDDEPVRAAAMRERLMSWVDTSSIPGNASADLVAAARLPQEPQHMGVPLHVRFGGFVEVLGCDLPTPKVRVGEEFHAVFYYRVLARTSHAHSFEVTFVPDDGGATWDKLSLPHIPVSGRYSTTEWRPGELLRDDVPLRVEEDVRATGYAVRLRVRNEHTGQVVPPDTEHASGEDLFLGHVDVLP